MDKLKTSRTWTFVVAVVAVAASVGEVLSGVAPASAGSGPAGALAGTAHQRCAALVGETVKVPWRPC